MTFLNPFLLVALAAAAIPLLLHLLNLRKLRRVDFSSLRFLKELQKTRIRRLKLRQLLLLLLRIGLVVFAVLAFARPALQGTSGLPGARASTTAVILLDNSYSMQVRDGNGTRLRQAQSAAHDLVDLLGEGDEAYLVPMADVKSAAGTEPTRNRETLRGAIDSIGLGYRRADLEESLRMAASLLDRSDNLNKEVYIITDAQRANAPPTIDSLRILGAGTRVYLLPIGSGGAPAGINLGLDSIRLLSSVFEVNRPVTVRAWVHNYSAADAENAPVSLFINDERTAQGSVTVAAGRTEAIELTAAPKRPGPQACRVELGADALDADNRRWIAFPVAGTMHAVIAGSPESLNYLGLALGVAGSGINAQRVTPAGLPSVDLADVSAVVLADATPVDPGRIEQYVRDGGGLVIYGGPGLDRAAFNTGLGAQLGIGLGAPVTAPSNAPLGFGAVEREHPLFNGVFDPANPGTVEPPHIAQAVPASGGETIIALSNGAGFMSGFRHGRGRVVYIAVPPTQAWSDLVTRSVFVPIAARSLLYVGAHGDPYPHVVVGESATVPLPPRASLPDQVKVTSPNGRDEFVAVRKYPSGASITYDRAVVPGVYRISTGGADVALFTADMGSGESDLAPMSEERLREVITAAMTAPDKFSVLRPSGGNFGKAVIESRFGLELWKYMLALALLCAFAEMIVGRTPKEPAAA
ncbi:MAG TPA: VWA domain-containing protein [Candidatus Kapabacteria bacterium]|nr:VWA domain-containing protein [Candidatus Kapabacteria bacterium]